MDIVLKDIDGDIMYDPEAYFDIFAYLIKGMGWPGGLGVDFTSFNGNMHLHIDIVRDHKYFIEDDKRVKEYVTEFTLVPAWNKYASRNKDFEKKSSI